MAGAPSAGRAGGRPPARASRVAPADAPGQQRLVEIPHGLVVRRPRHGAFPGLSNMPEPYPSTSPQHVVGQAFDLFGHPVTRGRLEGLDNLGVQGAAPLLQGLP